MMSVLNTVILRGFMADEKLSPCFIQDIPSDEDQFKGQSHSSVANEMSKIISGERITCYGCEVDKDHLIGLEGPWGSGKSTVIKLLEKKLGNSYKVVTYDVWARQEDLQRRSFLEWITTQIVDSKDLIPDSKKKRWKRLLKKLLAKTITTSSVNIPKVGIAYYLIIIYAVLKYISDIILELFSLAATWEIVLSLLPLMIVLFLALIDLIGAIKYARSNNKWSLKIIPQWFKSTVAMYKGDHIKNTTHETIFESEPSVEKFIEHIQKIDKDLKQTLVIVFDDMDRLPHDKVMAMWSLINTFFAHKDFRKIWVIVPFNRNNIQIDANDHIECYIEKTFTKLFRVSPPVLTHWRAYLKQVITKAFGEINDNEINIVLGLYSDSDFEKSPRKMIQFTNDMVSSYLTNPESLKLRYHAAFALYKKYIVDEPVKTIVTLKIPTQSHDIVAEKGKPKYIETTILSPEYRKPLAAIYYNVKADDASQVLLNDDMEKAFSKKDYDNAILLSEDPNLYDIMEARLDSSNSIDASAWILTFNELQNRDSIDKSKIERIWSKLTEIEKSTIYRGYNYDHNQAVRILISHIESDKALDFLLIRFAYRSKFNSDLLDGDKTLPKEAIAFTEDVEAVNEIIKKRNWDFKMSDYLHDSIVCPEFFATMYSILRKNVFEYKVSYNPKVFSKWVISQFKGKDLNLIKDLDFGILKNKLESIEEKKQIDSICEHIDNEIIPKQMLDNINIGASNLPIIYSMRKTFDTYHIPTQSQNILIIALEGCSNENDIIYDIIAMLYVADPLLKSIAPLGQSMKDFINSDHYDEIADRILRYASLNDLIEKANTPGNNFGKNVVRSIVKNMVISLDPDDKNNYLKYYNWLVTELRLTPEELLKYFNSINIPVEINDMRTFEGYFPDSSIIKNCVDVDNTLSHRILDKYIDFSKVIDSSAWESDIVGNLYHTKASIILLKRNYQNFKMPFAALERIREIIKSTVNPEFSLFAKKEMQEAIMSIGYNEFTNSFKNARDKFCNEIMISDAQFKVYFKPLIEVANLGEKADSIRCIIEPVLGNVECFEIVKEYADKIVKFPDACWQDANSFIDRIKNEYEQHPDDPNLKLLKARVDLLTPEDKSEQD